MLIIQLTGKMKNNKIELIPSLKTNNILLDEAKDNEICKQMENIINVKNATKLFYLSHHFKSTKMSNISLLFIERFFQMVVESKTFLELDYIHVGKIISSDELNVDSELQIINVVEDWLSHKRTERSKYAKDLLLKIRLSLLSDPALNYILEKKPSFNTNAECVGIIKHVLENKKDSHSSKTSVTSRYCKQDKFNIIICGGENNKKALIHFNDVYSVNDDNFCNVNNLPPMLTRRSDFKAVCIKGEVYIFGGSGSNHNYIRSIEKYSPANNSWENVADIFDDGVRFCAVSFMGNVYFMGGLLNGPTYSCIKFDTINLTWTEISRMNETRCRAACAVFEGRVVVSGGINCVYGSLNTVEAYDHVADSWSHMPNMIESRDYHKSVAVKNKLFVVGGSITRTSEVYDSSCHKFVLLKPPPVCFTHYPAEIISIGSKLTVFNHTGRILFYDIEKNEWTVKRCDLTKGLQRYSCVKLPQL